MSDRGSTEKKRRKLYLGPDERFVIPRSTRWYNNRAAQGNVDGTDAISRPGPSAAPDCSGADQPLEFSDGPPSDSQENVIESDDACNMCDSIGGCCDPGDGSAAPEIDFEYGSGEDSEGSIADTEDCWSDGTTHDDPQHEPNSVPRFDESDLLAKCVADFGSRTLPGSKTTVAVAIVLIMSFIVAHGLPWTAVDDLLKLVDALFGFRDCGLPRTKYLLRKLWSQKCASVVNYHYFCSKCRQLLKLTADKLHLSCSKCVKISGISEVKAAGNFFVILDLKKQFLGLIAKVKKLLYENLCKIREQSEVTCQAITDITTGMMHRSLRQEGVLEWTDLTVVMNTDGSPLYKSSNSSVWPIQVTVNELPVSCRSEHTLLAGLWFGRKHPDMQLFIGRFAAAMLNVGQLLWEYSQVTLQSRVYTICVCVDAPARASVSNHHQFNGTFGCPWCLTCGTKQEGRWLYLDTEPGVERTAAGVRRDMKLAQQLQTPVNGLKGPSPLAKLPHLDLVWSLTVEYMHCVLLGVTRQFTEYWLDSSNNDEPYYMGRRHYFDMLNKRLLSIRPPHHFTRLPRTLQERCYWKAHEWRNWLLFYCLPCCRHILPLKYLRHFALLSEAIFILLQEELSMVEIDRAERLLKSFVARAANLYGQRCMSFNLHQLLHIAQAARNFGPLWAHSAFGFESGNGQIVKLVNAAKAVPQQILQRVVMTQELRLLLSTVPFPENVHSLCLSFLGYPKTEKAQLVDGCYMFGLPKIVNSLSVQETSCLQSLLNQVPIVQEHFRFLCLGTIFHSERYRAGKRNSSVFESKDGDVYMIKRIFEITNGSSVVNGTVVLLCAKVVSQNSVSEFPPHVSDCFFSLAYTLVPLKVCDIAKPCILISFGGSEDYVCSVPNLVERD